MVCGAGDRTKLCRYSVGRGKQGPVAVRRRGRSAPSRPAPIFRVLVFLMQAVLVTTACGGRPSESSPTESVLEPKGPAAPVAAGPGDEQPSGEVEAVVDQPIGVVVGHVTGSSIEPRTRPDPTAPTVTTLTNPTELGGPLVFQLVESQIPPNEEWVEVYLPVRPNGTTGWVRQAELELTRNPYRLEIDVSRHRLQVFRGDERWLETTVAIGTGATPTPVGEFYIIELLQVPDPTGLYGPFAFGLSGFSETLTSFAGGDGVIGIHGTDEPEALGTDVSHGCVRVHNDVITTLAGMIPLGTPVRITD